MESLLKINKNDKEFVRNIYGTNESNLRRDINILKEWMKKQQHLPQGIQDDKFFENILIRNKNMVEKSKQKIDDYYTLRGLRGGLFDNYEKLVPSKLVSMALPLPILTKDKQRLLLIKPITRDPSEFKFKELLKINLAVSDLMFEYDYFSGIRIILDFENFGFDSLKQLTPVDVAKFIELIQDGYSNRIVSLEFVNLSGVFTALMQLCKMVLKPKLYNKIHVHKNLDSVLKSISKELLPIDYGGDLPHTTEMLKKWDDVFKNHYEFFVNNLKCVSNEKLRSEPCKYGSDFFGVDGTFKKINLD